MALAGCAALGWLGLYGFAWNDYDTEARPALTALLEGHLSGFLHLAPAYGGSLLERAPFALLPGLWGGGALAVYRMAALPCLLASAVLGVWLLARMRAEGRPRLARAVALGVCVANPITLRALELGHPEELLGGCLCVIAVLLAGRGRGLAAGVVLGLAIANKEWALLAAGPVLMVLPAGRRLRCAGAAGTVAAAVLAPFALAGPGGLVASTRAVASTPSAIFQPWQVWWFLGAHGAPVHGLFGALKPGYRTAPAWTGRVSHPLIILLGAALTAALWWTRSARARAAEPAGPGAEEAARDAPPAPPARRPRAAWSLPVQDALLALALLLLLRCLLDTWDTVYYPLPFVLALLAWEATRETSKPPVLALAASALLWVSFQWLPLHASADVQAAFFLAWSLPLAIALGARLFGQPGRAPQLPALTRRPVAAQETTVSALGRLVRTSWASSPTTTRSSMRTPSSPGR
jgi:hypothetical protein